MSGFAVDQLRTLLLAAAGPVISGARYGVDMEMHKRL